MKINVITVSRQFGSGGRTVARMIAQKLGWAYYDKEIIEQLALKSGFDPDYIREHGEYSASNRFAYSFVSPYVGSMSVNDYLWCEQRKLILELAEKGPCVIVGRCADHILKDHHDCLNLFIHAPLALRAKRVVELYGESETKPQKRVREKDKKRAANYLYYTDREWGKAENYHLCLDSGAVGIERIVNTVVNMVQNPVPKEDFFYHL